MTDKITPSPAEQHEEVMDMALCEAHSVVLRVGQLYRFTPVGECPKCKRMAKEAEEVYGPGMGAPAPHPTWTNEQIDQVYQEADALLAQGRQARIADDMSAPRPKEQQEAHADIVYLPNGEAVTEVYAAYQAGMREAQPKEQPTLKDQLIAVDVSTGEGDKGIRIFARLTGEEELVTGEKTLSAVAISSSGPRVPCLACMAYPQALSNEKILKIIADARAHLIEVVRGFGDVACARYIEDWCKPESIAKHITQNTDNQKQNT